MGRYLLSMLLILAFSLASQAQDLDLARPEDAVTLYRKVACSSTHPEFIRSEFFSGPAVSFVPGQPEIHLFDILGSGVRQCETVIDENGQTGFKMYTSIALTFLHKDTGVLLRNWENPFTGETVAVMPTYRKEVSAPIFPVTSNGEAFRFNLESYGAFGIVREYGETSFNHPLSQDFPEFVAPIYHYKMPHVRYFLAEELFSKEVSQVSQFTVAITRVGSWYPWMKMPNTEGQLVWYAVTHSVDRPDDIPEPLLSELKQSKPSFLSPPPIGYEEGVESWQAERNFLKDRR